MVKHSPERLKEILKGLNKAYFGTYTCDLIKEALDYIEELENRLGIKKN